MPRLTFTFGGDEPDATSGAAGGAAEEVAAPLVPLPNPAAATTRVGDKDVRTKGSGVGGVLAYVRRSDEDRTGKPINAQVETIIDYVENHMMPKGSKNVREFFLDNGFSGALDIDRRPALKRMVETMRHLCETTDLKLHIIVYDESRLARSVEVGQRLKGVFETAGARLHLASPRMEVAGTNGDLFFGIKLQLASNERSMVIARTKKSFEHNKDWDPRLGYGWHFAGAGTKPVPIQSEQKVLKEIKEMFCDKGMTSAEIAKAVQAKHGPRRRRCKQTEDDAPAMLPWRAADIDTLSRRQKWEWGGSGVSKEQLNTMAVEAVAAGMQMERFYELHKDLLVGGIRINRPMLRTVFMEGYPPWKLRAIRLMKSWVSQEHRSVDDLCILLGQEIPREDDKQWPRQSAYEIVTLARAANERETTIERLRADPDFIARMPSLNPKRTDRRGGRRRCMKKQQQHG